MQILCSDCLRSSMSVPVVYQRRMRPCSSRKGLKRMRNQRYFPSLPRCPLLIFKRQTARERVPPLVLQAHYILGMKDFGAKIWPICVFDAAARVIQHPFVGIENVPFRTQDDNCLWDGVDNLSEFGFGLLYSLKCRRKCCLRSVTLDGDSSNATGMIDQLNFARPRLSNFAIMHAEGPQHLTVMRHDGARPGGAQSTLQSKLLNLAHFGSEAMSETKTGCRR